MDAQYWQLFSEQCSSFQSSLIAMQRGGMSIGSECSFVQEKLVIYTKK